ncbi:MAG: glutaminyl-peptide cyclotransferase [Gemmatimonas sp.]|nr:glutaminyl-peptide cyclotransferase [Gemmatimonas sp.]MCA2994687.1 glutaminyl-peptide cyclotransferase [Gemmatimonas sp.]
MTASSSSARGLRRRSRATTAMIALSAFGFVGLTGAFAGCSEGAPAPADTSRTVAPGPMTPGYGVDVVAEFPHDTGAFTQGLLWHEGKLFESTGTVGKSNIREVALASGKALRQQPLEEPHFGEGIVILGGTLYQITWQSGKAFTYDWKTFRRTGELRYDGEGWGLTTDGTSLIMSNGSNTLIYRDPKTFAAQKAVTVTDRGNMVSQLNELEWVKGEIWANVWQKDSIARIDPATGKVTGWIDLTGLLPQLDRTGKEDVLNGIAYDAATDRIHVTGKLWPKLYEIRLKAK